MLLCDPYFPSLYIYCAGCLVILACCLTLPFLVGRELMYIIKALAKNWFMLLISEKNELWLVWVTVLLAYCLFVQTGCSHILTRLKLCYLQHQILRYLRNHLWWFYEHSDGYQYRNIMAKLTRDKKDLALHISAFFREWKQDHQVDV